MHLLPTSLKCEFQTNPLAVESATPRLSWQVAAAERGARQSAYHLRAASSPELLAQDRADLWDTGCVSSDDTHLIPYAGRPLASVERVHWQVRVWDEHSRPSPFSAPAFFQTALLTPADFRARWIAAEAGDPQPAPTFFRGGDRRAAPPTPEEAPAVYLRREVVIPREVRRATLTLCGLGYAQFHIDGRSVTDRLDPAMTNYAKTVLYRGIDVTAQLAAPGAHVLAAILGNGFYNLVTADLFQYEKAPWRTPPRLFAQIDLVYADGSTATLVTDGSWKQTTKGPIRFNCVRGGETIDNNFDLGPWLAPGYDDSAWSAAVEVAPPRGRLRPQAVPPIRVDEVVSPVAISEPTPGVYIADFGRNLVGVVRFTAAGPKGTRITLDFNEQLRPDGTLDTSKSASHTYGRYQHQVFILSGRGGPDGVEVFEPRFTYHAFRYVQIQGLERPPRREDLSALRFHTALEHAGSLETADGDINALHDAARRTLEDCTFGLPCAEPVREKIGWNGDLLFALDSYFYLFDSATLYRKAVADNLDGQNANGHVPPIFPTNGWGNLDSTGERVYWDDPWWGGALVDSVRALMAFHGDLPCFREAFEATRRYVDYLTTTAQQDIISWSLGDWCDAKWPWRDGNCLTPVPITSTLAYLRYTTLAARQATVLGRTEEADRYRQLAARIRSAFNARFYDPAAATYCAGSQSAQALALLTGAVPEADESRVVETLVREVDAADGHLTTGFIGTLPALYALADHGHADHAYGAVTKPSGSGWFYMLKLSGFPPTLGESIHPNMGTCHHQFGAGVAGYFYRCLAGIRPDPASPGFKHIVIRPAPPRRLSWLRAVYHSIRGPIQVAWARKGEAFTLDVTIPANTTATVYLPEPDVGRISESGVALTGTRGVKLGRTSPMHTVVTIESGTYAFLCRGKQE